MNEPLTTTELITLADLAVEAARAAGAIIAAHRGRPVETRHKATGASPAAQIVTQVDLLAQAAILELLQPSCAQYRLALLTEESPDDGERLRRRAFWSIDPLDGTLAFVNDTPGFCSAIALVAKDGTPLIAAVCDPVAGVLYRGIRGRGAWRDQCRIRVPPLDPGQPLVLRTDLSFAGHPWLDATQAGLARIAGDLGLAGARIELRTGGVMNALGILANPNYCYFKYPKSGNAGGSLWDYPTSACIFHEVAAIASDIFGQPLDLNRPDSTYMNHRGLLFAASEAIAAPIRALHRQLQPG